VKRAVATTLLVITACIAFAQDDPDLVPVPVTGLPAGARVLAYATVATETGTVLVVEIESADGTTAFYLFDYVDGRLVARAIGPRAIPADLSPPPTHTPMTRAVGSPGSRFWRVGTAAIDDRNEQLVSAPSLEELRFAEIGTSPWRLSPPPESALTVRRLSVATDDTVLDACVLEPNITAVSDRMTTFGAWWVRPFGEPHMLVGMLFQTGGTDARGGLRLYTEQSEVVAIADPALAIDPNSMPDLVSVDLTGDGERELVFFSTAPGAARPVLVYRFERRNGGARILAFNLCSVRMNGADVARLQRALEGRGFGVGPHGIDGWYGPDTRAAVIRFEREADLPVDGIVDDDLRALLGM
jgi:hypothetical protein